MENSYLYILQSLRNGSYYVGCSADPGKRLEQHNKGRVVATKYKRPWEIRFTQQLESSKKAKQIEYNLKRRKSRLLIEQIIKDQKIKLTSESSSDG
jgi:putative endonuclease